MPPEPAFLFLLLTGVALRVIQFLSGSSLWVDEVALALAVKESSWVDVLSAHLGQRQIAPAGFVALVKALLGFGGGDDLTLRIPSFLASVAGLCLGSVLVKRLLRRPWDLVALGSLVFSPPLLHLSGILKQYSSDVFFSIALTLLLLNIISRSDTPGKRAWICGLSVIFSSTALFLCFAGFVALTARRPRPTLSRIAVMNLIGGLLVLPAILILHARAGVPTLTNEYMAVFWQGAFVPPVSEYPTWLMDQLRTLIPQLFGGLYMVPRPWLGSLHWLWIPVLLLALLGLLDNWRLRPAVVVLIAFPFLALLTASRLGGYPISPRTCLFLLPQLVILTLWGVTFMLSKTPRIFQAGVAIVLFATIVLPTILDPPPYRPSHFGELFAAVSGHVREGDKFWVDFHASDSWVHYARGIPTEDVHLGQCLLGRPREQLREVAQFRGSPRVWVVFGWTPSFFSREAEGVLTFLRSVGVQEQEIRVGPTDSGGYYAILFDLENDTGFRNADPDSFHVGEPVDVPEYFSCEWVSVRNG